MTLGEGGLGLVWGKSTEAEAIATIHAASLDASLEAMRLDPVDIFFLHSNICANDFVNAHGNDPTGDHGSMAWG